MISSVSTTIYPIYPQVTKSCQPGDTCAPEEKRETGSDRAALKTSNETSKTEGNRLTEEEQREVEKLKTRDREVRAHEAAHQAAAGQYVKGGASFTYERGPDGVNYAVGGEVQIETSAVPNDPQETLKKAEIIRAAALAPAEPSAQDLAVASEAVQMATKARAEILAQQQQEVKGGSGNKVAAYNQVAGSENRGSLINTFA